MKFEKYVKSLGGHGIIHKRSEEEKWLTSKTASARIPDSMSGVLAEDIVDMPEFLTDILKFDMANEPCELVKAVMPYPGGAIKDCIRVYANENGSTKIAIRNDDFALIAKSDITEMHTKYNKETENYDAVALILKRVNINPDADPEIVGVIFPIDIKEIQ